MKAVLKVLFEKILDFETVDRTQHQPVLKWDKLKFDGLAVSTQPRRFVTRILTGIARSEQKAA